MIFDIDFDAFGDAFWSHFASPNGAKLPPETEQKRVEKVTFSKSGLGAGLEPVLGWSWGGPGRPGDGSEAVLGAFWEPFELQKAVKSCKANLERQKP